MDAITGCQAIVLEANHDVEMVNRGPYPSHLKRRILSRKGHLCNEDCAKGILALYDREVRHVVLGHLSGENNTPELAMDTSLRALESQGIAVNQELGLYMAWRDHVGQVYNID